MEYRGQEGIPGEHRGHSEKGALEDLCFGPTNFYDLVTRKDTVRTLYLYGDRSPNSRLVRETRRRSVHMKPVRNNNDVGGWHRRLNQKAREGKLSFQRLLLSYFPPPTTQPGSLFQTRVHGYLRP
ncbi:hypothetical protein Bbelb_018620 [Branchiostoma belcheri]|nr:hypothetical protein Bbelb_018620 [Branchiostoma belcheri]